MISHPLNFDYSFACRVMVDAFCLFAPGVVAGVCCRLLFSFGIVHFFFTYLLFTPGYFFFSCGDLHPPTYTRPPILQGFFADAHRFTPKCWWVVGGVGCTTFRESPYESDFILMTQVRATICCLLILFITQSGSCTLRRPRLLCCFPLRRQQIPSDKTYSPLSSTATKTQTSKGLARRLNKSLCNSGNELLHDM